MTDITPSAPEVPGMVHAGWTCEHDTSNPGDVHTEWRSRRRKPGWKRKKAPGTVRSITPVYTRGWGSWPTEPGCLKARPLYAKLDEEAAAEVAPAMPPRISPKALASYLIDPNRDQAWELGARTWQRQEDIPADVQRVLDLTGDVMRRIDDTQDFMPLYHNGKDMGMDHVHRVDSPGSNNFAPFTELRKAGAL